MADRCWRGWRFHVHRRKTAYFICKSCVGRSGDFVLDEATSSIDTETEQLIQNAISYLLKDRTSFIIAHRLSTIRQADVILVVKAGKIIEQGTHDELMAMKGYYHDLYTQQFKEEMMEELVI